MLADWTLDEGAGTVAFDTASQIDNHGTISGAAWTTGRHASAREFDGISDRVTAAPVGGLSSAASLEAWIYPVATGPGSNQFVAINGDGSGSTWNILLSLYEGDVHFDVYTVERYIERHTATVPVTPNAWNHIVGVFDGTTHTVRIYVNGAPAGTWTGTGSTLRNQASSEFTIGAMKYWGSWLNVFEGAIDEVVLYDDVLTAGQVQQRYLGGATSGVLGNDTDVDGDPLTAAVVAGPSHGTLSLDPAGSFIYEPDSDWNGVDSFTYDASDGSLTDPATVTITINPVNDAPVAADDAYSTDEDVVLNMAAPGWPSVLAHWTLDEGAGTVAFDTASRIDNHGTISGAAWTTGRHASQRSSLTGSATASRLHRWAD